MADELHFSSSLGILQIGHQVKIAPALLALGLSMAMTLQPALPAQLPASEWSSVDEVEPSIDPTLPPEEEGGEETPEPSWPVDDDPALPPEIVPDSPDAEPSLDPTEPTEEPTQAPVEETETPEPEAAPAPDAKPNSIPVGAAPKAPSGTTRTNGANYPSLSVKLSQAYKPGVPVVYIGYASGWKYNAGVAAAAAEQNAPFLYSWQGSIPWDVKAELLRLKPGKIVLVGPTSSLKSSLDGQYKQYAPIVERIGTKNHFQTSRDLAEGAFNTAPDLFLTTGNGWHNLLASNAAAAKKDAPLVVANGTKSALAQVELDFLKRLKVKTIYVIGSTKTLSSGIRSQLKSLGYTVKGYTGTHASDTAGLLTQTFWGKTKAPAQYFVSNKAPANALVVQSVAGAVGAPVFTVSSSQNYCMLWRETAAARDTSSANKILVGSRQQVGNTVANLQDCPKQATGTTIKPGQIMKPGTALKSSGKHSLWLLSNGNLAMYVHGKLAWQSNTKHKNVSYFTVTSNGQLRVVYDGSVVWSYGHERRANLRHLKLYKDGNLESLLVDGKPGSFSMRNGGGMEGNRHSLSTPKMYSQTNGAWSSKRHGGLRMGETACVPTALAMAFSSSGVTVRPDTLASYLHGRGLYNSGGQFGAGSEAIVAAGGKYDTMVRGLKTKSQITQALKQGKPVIAMIDGPRSIWYGTGTHAVVIKGYSNGKTVMYDPAGGVKRGWWSIESLWSYRSGDALDRKAGAVFWAIG